MKKYFNLLILTALGLLLTTKVDADSKTLTVALEQNTQPLSYNNKNGKLVGYEVDVIKKINSVIKGYHIEIEAVSAEAAEVGIESGKYDLVGGGLFKTPTCQVKCNKFIDN